MDIDIDVPNTFKPETLFKITRASTIEKDELTPHTVGVYFQNMPRDPVTGLAAIPYHQAEEYGFTKIDMIHLNLLSYFKSKQEMLELMEIEPNWKLLEDREFVSKLFHLSKQFEIVYKVKPTSVLELADVLCLIRPYKRILVDKYIKNKKAVRPELYTKRDPSDLRKSHAVAYALLVTLQMNILEKNYTYEAFD
jgi:DNA polymerase III alpha subunit